MRSTCALLQPSLAALLLSLTFTVHADDNYVSAMRYISLDGQTSDADSKQYSATGSFTIGNYTWLQGSVGNLTDDSANGLGDLQNYAVGLGLKGRHLQFRLDLSHYKNDADYKQNDVTASLDWFADKFSLGIDGFHRKTEDKFSRTVTDTFPVLGTATVTANVSEELTGNGFGAHGSVNFTDRFSLSVGGMGFNYDRSVAIDASVSTSQYPLIAQRLAQIIAENIQQRLERRNLSILTRNVVPLDSSYNLGMSYLFDSAALSAQYLRDKTLNSDTVTNTYSLGVSVFIGDHWIVAPLVGESIGGNAGNATFGGLSASYNW